MFKNLFKNTSTNLTKLSLALRALVGTLAGAAYVQANVRVAFWFLVAGAILDFIIQLLPPETKIKPGAMVLVVLVSVSLFWLSGCRSIRPETSSVITDSSTTTYKPVDVPIKGAKVNQVINVDSLLKANAEKGKKYVADSINAVKSGNPIPQKPNISPTSVSDPQTKVQLQYWVDQFGKLQVSCESKDQTVQILVAENNRLRSEVKTVTVTTVKTPFWNYILFGVLGVFSFFGAVYLVSLFKR